ncbi:MAG TPA: D-glycero-beta-D-manno-heptose-7-phosphate kinase [Burkholderiales bacterium]
MKKTNTRKKFSPAALAKARLLVVGDAMLDRYWYGEVDRISPEAPVPIVRIDPKKEEERPGGAANVACNAAALGAQVTLLSVVGVDEPGARLENLLKRKRVRALLHHDRSIMTTVKLRVVARHQQLVRVDFETSPSHEVLASKLADFEKKLPACDVVILSDYGKGGLKHIARMIALANRAGKTVLVDPKGNDYEQYRNATMLTPNRVEFQQMVGVWKSDKEFAAKARQLMRKLNLKALLVTRGEEGMTLFSNGGMLKVRAQAREVFDVSGAGDTVIAALGVMLASGADLHDAVRIANRAAGIVVGKLGTAVVHREELFGS